MSNIEWERRERESMLSFRSFSILPLFFCVFILDISRVCLITRNILCEHSWKRGKKEKKYETNSWEIKMAKKKLSKGFLSFILGLFFCVLFLVWIEFSCWQYSLWNILACFRLRNQEKKEKGEKEKRAFRKWHSLKGFSLSLSLLLTVVRVQLLNLVELFLVKIGENTHLWRHNNLSRKFWRKQEIRERERRRREENQNLKCCSFFPVNFCIWFILTFELWKNSLR